MPALLLVGGWIPINPPSGQHIVSGRDAGYAYGPEVHCMSGLAYGQQAIKQCEKNGEACFLFAVGNDIRADYEVE